MQNHKGVWSWIGFNQENIYKNNNTREVHVGNIKIYFMLLNEDPMNITINK